MTGKYELGEAGLVWQAELISTFAKVQYRPIGPE